MIRQLIFNCDCINLVLPLFSFICLIPGVIHPRDSQPIHESLSSIQFCSSSITLLASSIPIIIDLLLELLFNERSRKFKYIWIPRAMIGLITILTAAQFVLQSYSINIYQQTMPSFLFTLTCFKITLSCSLNYCLSISYPAIFSPFQTNMTSIFFCIGLIIRYYCLIDAFTINITILSLIYVSNTISFMFITLWIYKLIQATWSVNVLRDAGIVASCFYLIAAIISYFLSLFFWTNAFDRSGNLSLMSRNSTMAVILIYASIILMIAIVPGRISQIETLIAEVVIFDYIFSISVYHSLFFSG